LASSLFYDLVVFPEIPCSFDGTWKDEDAFEDCVELALDELKAANVLAQKQAKRFRKSMLNAFEEFNEDDD
jgi:hypothetical protein